MLAFLDGESIARCIPGWDTVLRDGIAIALKFTPEFAYLSEESVCVSAQEAQHNLLGYTIALTKHSSLNQPTVS